MSTKDEYHTWMYVISVGGCEEPLSFWLIKVHPPTFTSHDPDIGML
ncbi:MAG TPA: hypothetical protein VFD57_00550 [Clostridia bacterium]|nr:hypothetical protein [Clostridia bacterium]